MKAVNIKTRDIAEESTNHSSTLLLLKVANEYFITKIKLLSSLLVFKILRNK